MPSGLRIILELDAGPARFRPTPAPPRLPDIKAALAFFEGFVAKTSSAAQAEAARDGTAIDAQFQSELRSSLNGDGDAYARIIRRYQDLLARRMFRFSRNPAEVEELVHDVFVEAYFSLRHYRAEAPFEHWLQGIATRVGYRFWKRRRIDRERRAALEKQERSRPKSQPPDADASGTLAQLMEQLPPRDRLVVTLLYLEERSVAEAARMAGWSQTMIKVQAFRARGKLRKLLEGYEASQIPKKQEKSDE